MQQPCVRIPTRIQVDALMLRIRQILGIGAFVVVYKAVDEEEPWQIYALKEVLCLNASQFHNAVREVQILKQLSHENVISLIGVDHLHDAQGLHMLILTEFCVGGNLKECLHRPSSDETNERWIRKISSAVAYLHLHDIVHLDLKADNVLLTATGDIKLADFGLAREFIPVKQFVEYGDDGSGMMSYIQKYIDSRVGPPHWVAPEFFHRRYNKRADSFSLGTLISGSLSEILSNLEAEPITVLMYPFLRLTSAATFGWLELALGLQWQRMIQISPFNFQELVHKDQVPCKESL